MPLINNKVGEPVLVIVRAWIYAWMIIPSKKGNLGANSIDENTETLKWCMHSNSIPVLSTSRTSQRFILLYTYTDSYSEKNRHFYPLAQHISPRRCLSIRQAKSSSRQYLIEHGRERARVCIKCENMPDVYQSPVLLIIRKKDAPGMLMILVAALLVGVGGSRSGEPGVGNWCCK